MKPEPSSQKLDPEGSRRDYLCVLAVLGKHLADVDLVRRVFREMDEDMAGGLAGRLRGTGLLDSRGAEELERTLEARMKTPLDAAQMRGVDRIFRRQVYSKSSIDQETLAAAVGLQRAGTFRPLWEVLPEMGAMEPVLARILQARSRARYFRRETVELLGGSQAIWSAPRVGPGSMLGRYRVEKEIGRDRMGVVYRAVPAAGGDEVALRVLAEETLPGARLARHREALEATAGLRHDGIVGVVEVSYEKDLYYIATQFVEGEPLDRHVARADPGPEARIAFIRDAARTLDFAHRKGVLHRDLRPANVRIAPDLSVYLADFGLYRLLGLPDDSSTLPYRAPEELGGPPGRPGPLSDVYSLGVVLYELLVGRLPRGDPDGDEEGLSSRIKNAREPDPDGCLCRLEPVLADVVRRAIHPRPEERTGSASEFAHELSRYLSPGSRLDLGPSDSSPVVPVRRPPVRAIAVTAVLVALAGAAAAFLFFGSGSRKENAVPGPARGEDPHAEDSRRALRDARQLASRGDFSGALEAAERGLALAPRDPKLLMERGRARVGLARFEEATRDFEEAVRLAPGDPEARLLYAERLLEAGRYEQAAEELDHVLVLEPESGRAHLLRGRAAISLGRLEQGVLDLTEATRLRPGDADVFFHLGRALHLRGEYAEARTALLECLRLAPEHPQKEEIANLMKEIDKRK
ncbi:MAG: tetratricopeptide repeat protein [Planctomycetes bacterium]|nr:tetratricopeptide repeat protein [Planctomycetota bacterium]